MTLNQFRKFARAEETMIRASMPRTSLLDPTPLPAFAQDDVPGRVRVRWSAGRKVNGFLLSEVAHA